MDLGHMDRGRLDLGSRALLRADAAWRLGPRAVAQAAWHRSAPGRWAARRALPDRAPPSGPYLPREAPAASALPDAHAAAVLRRADAVSQAPDWHGPFDPAPHALTIDLFAAGDVRPVWERNRLADVVVLAQAARLDPGGGHLARAEALLGDWVRHNPPFSGPNWACGQEAALRALHLCLAQALLGTTPAAPPGAGMRALLGLHAQRIAATPAYAAAQDNNHPVSEAAGLYACGLALGDAALARTGAARLATAVDRLVAPCGGFAQVSTGYHRLLLDTLAVAEWLRRAHAAPAWAAVVPARAAAATLWLARLTDPATGALPRLGHQDGSCLADLSLAGAADARGSVERAARLFLGAVGVAPADPGCAWLGLAAPAGTLPGPPPVWRAAGTTGWQAAGARALLRTGPLRFRPGQADLLHLDLWDGAVAVVEDGGTGAYNPPAGHGWWHAHFTGTAAHNTVAFDGEDQMPRVSRFLFARWPRMRALPDGAALRDHRGRGHARRVTVKGRCWTVRDTLDGPFREAVLRWRLGPGDWAPMPDGVVRAGARITVTADAPIVLAIEAGWVSPAYGVVRAAQILTVRARRPIAWMETRIRTG